MNFGHQRRVDQPHVHLFHAGTTLDADGTLRTSGGRVLDVTATGPELAVARTRAVAGDLPVCVGLGVSNADQAAEVARFADGVIVGSAYVRQMLEGAGSAGVRALSAQLAEGVRRRAEVRA